MNIMEALEKLSGYLDGLSEYAEMSEEELIEMGEVEGIIHDYIIKREKEASIRVICPACDCGDSIVETDIVDDWFDDGNFNATVRYECCECGCSFKKRVTYKPIEVSDE